jgi:CheY-like chemotaxis protein
VDESAHALIAQGSDRNPRRLKRFINAFVLEHTLDPEAAKVDPDTLIRELILRTFFQEFVRLSARGGDPLAEFIEYLRVREAVASPDLLEAADSSEIQRFFGSHRTPVEFPVTDAALAALEENLPEPFPRLAENVNFVSLVEFLQVHGREESRSRLEKVAEAAPVEAPSDLAADLSDVDVTGVRVLWIDDEPDRNQMLIEAVRQAGGDVVTVTSGEAADMVLKSDTPVHLLVSDITAEAATMPGSQISNGSEPNLGT